FLAVAPFFGDGTENWGLRNILGSSWSFRHRDITSFTSLHVRCGQRDRLCALIAKEDSTDAASCRDFALCVFGHFRSAVTQPVHPMGRPVMLRAHECRWTHRRHRPSGGVAGLHAAIAE